MDREESWFLKGTLDLSHHQAIKAGTRVEGLKRRAKDRDELSVKEGRNTARGNPISWVVSRSHSEKEVSRVCWGVATAAITGVPTVEVTYTYMLHQLYGLIQ